MKKSLLKIIIALIILGNLSLPASAQEPEQHPVLEVLNWGLDEFPYPAWWLSLDASPGDIMAIWTNTEYPAMVSYRQESFTDPQYMNMPNKAIDLLVDSKWMEVAMENYDTWQETDRCYQGNIVVIELIAAAAGVDYTVRNWIWSQEDKFTRVFAAYESDRLPDFEAMADQQFNATARCE